MLQCPQMQCIWSSGILLYLHTIFGCFCYKDCVTRKPWNNYYEPFTESGLLIVPKCAVFSVAHENVHLIIHTLGAVLILKVWSPGPNPSPLDKLSVEALAPVLVCWGDRSRDCVFSIIFSCALCLRSACTSRDSVLFTKCQALMLNKTWVYFLDYYYELFHEFKWYFSIIILYKILKLDSGHLHFICIFHRFRNSFLKTLKITCIYLFLCTCASPYVWRCTRAMVWRSEGNFWNL